MSDRSLVVMKFGGTSVGTHEGRSAILDRVQEARRAGNDVVVVVSAMGRTGDPYATDTLLSLVEGGVGDPRERDLLASVGEVISAVVVAHQLRESGVDAVALTGPQAGIVAEGPHGEGRIAAVDIDAIRRCLDCGEVAVVCGFQAATEHGEVITLGRGGSDTTACALGAALGATEVEIYTDVDGVMTADPRVCDCAQVLDGLSAGEMFQMARSGSRVVHTPAAELALDAGLDVRVRNTYTRHPGTLVTSVFERTDRVATAVSSTDRVVRFRVELGAAEGTPEHMSRQVEIYEALAAAGVSLDMFTPGGNGLVFSVATGDAATVEAVLSRIEAPFACRDDVAKVTLVGAGMHGVPGVMAKMSRLLSNAGVPVLQTADSHTTISVLVPHSHTVAAIEALHRGFDLGS
jgi:aspartate kinase